MPELIIPIGIPASGKSTYYAAKYPTYTHISKDEIRFEKYEYFKTGIDFKAEDEPTDKA